MGQHKHNLTAIKAKNGEIKPKEKGMCKAESRRRVQDACRSYIKETLQIYTPAYYNVCDDEFWRLFGG
jgi:hypothetical protein